MRLFFVMRFFLMLAVFIATPVPAAHSNVTLNFRSSLFEGKGTTDESWGLDNVTVTAESPGG